MLRHDLSISRASQCIDLLTIQLKGETIKNSTSTSIKIMLIFSSKDRDLIVAALPKGRILRFEDAADIEFVVEQFHLERPERLSLCTPERIVSISQEENEKTNNDIQQEVQLFSAEHRGERATIMLENVRKRRELSDNLSAMTQEIDNLISHKNSFVADNRSLLELDDHKNVYDCTDQRQQWIAATFEQLYAIINKCQDMIYHLENQNIDRYIRQKAAILHRESCELLSHIQLKSCWYPWDTYIPSEQDIENPFHGNEVEDISVEPRKGSNRKVSD
jgi:hypothetical protein